MAHAQGPKKVRFDGLDVTAMVSCLQHSLLGRRVVNIYNASTDGDSNNHSYVFKLAGTSSEESTEFLLLESGIRFHTIQQHNSAANTMPSPYCAKLRKHLRGLRLEQIRQLGDQDRVVLLQFGVGPSQHALILELYSKGNLILTDKDFTILALLRSHVYEGNKDDDDKEKEQVVAVQVGQVYPVSYATTWNQQPATAEKGDAKEDAASSGILSMDANGCNEWLQSELTATASFQPSGKKAKKKKGGGGLVWKTLLLKSSSGVSQYGPALLEHCLLCAELDPHQTLSLEQLPSESEWSRLQKSLSTEGPAVLQALKDGTHSKGYILYQPQPKKETEEVKDGSTDSRPPGELQHADKLLQEFQPHLLKQHEGRPRLQYNSFDAAVDDFYAHFVTQKRMLKALSAEAAAKDKLEKVRKDQEDRLEALQKEQEQLREQAEVVRLHADNVEKALTVINSALDSGMDWDQLEQLVQVEQENGNAIALLIERLELEQDAMILRLAVDMYDEESETLDVRISLKESAHANANSLFAKYRASKEKSQKTIEASTKALKAAEESAQRQLAEAQKRGNRIRSTAKRKPLWFEKFHWFVTSDNYLVLGGKDAQQNEMLVKRYLRPGDAYLHADVHGAASCILRAKRRRSKKNPSRTEPVPLSEQALREAGNFTICRSSAWSSRMVTSAWWVESHQVSKTAPTGEYLTVGSFMVRGKKNFLPPTQLEMGLAVLFRLSDDDADGIARHKNERRDYALMELESNELSDDDNAEEPVQPEPIKKEKLVTPEENVSAAVEPVEGDASAEDNEGDYADGVEADESDEEQQPNDRTDSGEAVPEGDGDASKTTASGKKKGLSVRDRKLIKKYGSLEEAERVQAARTSENGTDAPGQNEASSSAAKVSDTEEEPATMKRGKKSKLKRAQKKYADQDDADRELAMLALQGGEKNKKSDRRGNGQVTETQRKVAAETTALLVKDPSEVAANLPDEVRSALAECVTVKKEDGTEEVRWDKFDAGTLEQLIELEPDEARVIAARRLLALKKSTRIDNFSASLGGILRTIRKYGHENMEVEPVDSSEAAKRKTKEQKDAEASKWQQTIAEEGVVDVDSEENVVDDTTELSKLTSKPHPEDLLLDAVPVCAPYQTLSQYAFRVKLTPGNMKRGKAAKQCVDMLLKTDSGKPSASTGRCMELIKNVDDNDWVQVICADVKISAAGAAKANKKQKANNKKSGKKKR